MFPSSFSNFSPISDRSPRESQQGKSAPNRRRPQRSANTSQAVDSPEKLMRRKTHRHEGSHLRFWQVSAGELGFCAEEFCFLSTRPCVYYIGTACSALYSRPSGRPTQPCTGVWLQAGQANDCHQGWITCGISNSSLSCCFACAAFNPNQTQLRINTSKRRARFYNMTGAATWADLRETQMFNHKQ